MPRRFQNIGIITGVEAEANAFAPDAVRTSEIVRHLMVRRLALAGRDVSITCSGIGKVNATMAATILAVREQVDLLMVIGTAGKLSDIAGDCFILSEALQGDYGAWRPEAFAHYTAGDWPIGPGKLTPFKAFVLPNLGLPTARIVTSDAFVECPSRSADLRDTLAADLVDMETAAVAQVATCLGIPWAAIKATTDGANGESAGDFNANLARASSMAAAAAERLIALLP